MGSNLSPDPGVLENVHALDDNGISEVQVSGHRLHFVTEGNSLESRVQEVESVTHFVQAFMFGHLELTLAVKGIGLEKIPDFVIRIQEVIVICLLIRSLTFGLENSAMNRRIHTINQIIAGLFDRRDL